MQEIRISNKGDIIIRGLNIKYYTEISKKERHGHKGSEALRQFFNALPDEPFTNNDAIRTGKKVAKVCKKTVYCWLKDKDLFIKINRGEYRKIVIIK